MHHRNSRQHKLPDSIAVAENRIAGDVGEGTGEIPFPRPDLPRSMPAALECRIVNSLRVRIAMGIILMGQLKSLSSNGTSLYSFSQAGCQRLTNVADVARPHSDYAVLNTSAFSVFAGKVAIIYNIRGRIALFLDNALPRARGLLCSGRTVLEFQVAQLISCAFLSR